MAITQKARAQNTVGAVVGLVALGLILVTPAAAQTVRIVQTNSAGDNVHIIDPVTNEVVGEVSGIERAHGAAAAPDGSHIYVANEATNTVDVVNVESLSVTKKIPLSGHPNNIAITPNGEKVYVAIAQAPGAVEVIDTASGETTAVVSVHLDDPQFQTIAAWVRGE